MNIEHIIAQGNAFREETEPEQALSCYAMAFVNDRRSANAFNNYGNVLRELGEPKSAIPFLQHAIELDPTNPTAQFNLSVAYLLAGDYQRGWPQYESRWNFEHLAGTLPNYQQPRWVGQALKGKKILVLQEQGLGDTIQFCRFLFGLHQLEAKIILCVNNNLAPLFVGSEVLHSVITLDQDPGEFDYWIPMMSLPGVFGITLDNLGPQPRYLSENQMLKELAAQHLGPKTGPRVGVCWSGRSDTWINRHKGMPMDFIVDLINRHADIDWINLQIECSSEEKLRLGSNGVRTFNQWINSFADTAALLSNLDLVISVDTSVAHLAGALGLPTWIPLNWYGVDWRWLLNRDDSPWYDSVKLYRQPKLGDWASVIERLDLDLVKFKNCSTEK